MLISFSLKVFFVFYTKESLQVGTFSQLAWVPPLPPKVEMHTRLYYVCFSK